MNNLKSSVLSTKSEKTFLPEAKEKKQRASFNLPEKSTPILEEAEREFCQKLIRQRLSECGWSDQIKILCKDVIREKGSELTVTQLLDEVSRKAKDMLPTSVKNELMQKVKDQLNKKKGPLYRNSTATLGRE